MKTKEEDIVWCAMYLNQRGVTTALLVIDAFWIWIIIVLGLIIVLGFGIENIFFFY